MARLRINLWRALAVLLSTAAVIACLLGILFFLLAIGAFEERATLLAWACTALALGVLAGIVASICFARASLPRPVRARCPFCGYDLRGSPGYVCSECGRDTPFGVESPRE